MENFERDLLHTESGSQALDRAAEELIMSPESRGYSATFNCSDLMSGISRNVTKMSEKSDEVFRKFSTIFWKKECEE